MRTGKGSWLVLITVALGAALVTSLTASAGVDPRIGPAFPPVLSNTPIPIAAGLGATLNDSATLIGTGSIRATLDASATLSGGSSPTGWIFFQLYDGPAPCGFPIFTARKIVGGNGSYTASTSVLGHPGESFEWTASYSGDGNNPPLFIPCDGTTDSATTQGVTLSLADSLTQGLPLNDATGVITFSLYGPQQPSCTGAPLFTTYVPVAGNGTYSTPYGFTPQFVGTYFWQAVYFPGGSYNPGAVSDCVGVPVVVASGLGPGTTSCDGTFWGTGKDVTVPAGATCILLAGTRVTHDLMVAPGGTLIDPEVTVGHDLVANNPAGIAISGDRVGHDLRINSISGSATSGGNYICGTTVGHDLVVRRGLTSAGPFAVGVGCPGGGNTVGHDLVVTGNRNTVTVAGNSVGHHTRLKD